MAFPFSCPHFIGGGKAGPSSSKTRVQVVHTKWVLGHKSCSYRHSVRVAASHHASAAASTARPVRAAGPTPVVLPRLVCALCSFMVLCFNFKFRPLVATVTLMVAWVRSLPCHRSTVVLPSVEAPPPATTTTATALRVKLLLRQPLAACLAGVVEAWGRWGVLSA